MEPQFSCSVISDSLRPHGLQHTRLPCLSPTPGAYSNSRPSSQWCHPTISSSVVPIGHLYFFPPTPHDSNRQTVLWTTQPDNCLKIVWGWSLIHSIWEDEVAAFSRSNPVRFPDLAFQISSHDSWRSTFIHTCHTLVLWQQKLGFLGAVGLLGLLTQN